MRRDLRIAREYAHPPELVWRALTEPALIAEWLMQSDFRPEPSRPAPVVHGEHTQSSRGRGASSRGAR